MSGLMPKKQTPTQVQTMPDPDNAAVREERRRRQAEATSKSGRASTVLGTNGVYGSDKLG